MTDARRPSTLGMLIGLTLGMVVGFGLGIVVAIAASVPDPPPTTPVAGVVSGGAAEVPVGPTLSPRELDDCLRAAGIDPGGPRATGSIVCVGSRSPVPGARTAAPTAVPVPLTTAPAMTVAPTTR